MTQQDDVNAAQEAMAQLLAGAANPDAGEQPDVPDNPEPQPAPAPASGTEPTPQSAPQPRQRSDVRQAVASLEDRLAQLDQNAQRRVAGRKARLQAFHLQVAEEEISAEEADAHQRLVIERALSYGGVASPAPSPNPATPTPSGDGQPTAILSFPTTVSELMDFFASAVKPLEDKVGRHNVRLAHVEDHLSSRFHRKGFKPLTEEQVNERLTAQRSAPAQPAPSSQPTPRSGLV